MESTEAAGTILDLTEGWLPYPIDPSAVTGPEVVLAGLARCRRLLQGIVELADVPDVAGVLARVLFETWLASVYLLLGGEAGYERRERNDRINLYRSRNACWSSWTPMATRTWSHFALRQRRLSTRGD